MDWMHVFLQNSFVETLNFIVMVFGDRDFESKLSHKGGALMKGLAPLQEKKGETFFFF